MGGPREIEALSIFFAACHGVLWVLAVRNSVFPVTILS